MEGHRNVTLRRLKFYSLKSRQCVPLHLAMSSGSIVLFYCLSICHICLSSSCLDKYLSSPICLLSTTTMTNRKSISISLHSALKLGEKMQFQKYKNTFFAISKMAKNQFFAPEKSLKLTKMQF